jgi:hypothetical protein
MDFIRRSISLPTSPSARALGTMSSLDRRDTARMIAAGSISIAWHHDHESPQIYPALDVSENGARIEVSCLMPEGLTGRAVSHQPSGVRIDRPAMVVWCRAVRDDRGLLRHYEAGVRFF